MFKADDVSGGCSGTSVQQQVAMSRSQPAVTRSNRRIRSSGSEHLEIALQCLGLQPTANQKLPDSTVPECSQISATGAAEVSDRVSLDLWRWCRA